MKRKRINNFAFTRYKLIKHIKGSRAAERKRGKTIQKFTGQEKRVKKLLAKYLYRDGVSEKQ